MAVAAVFGVSFGACSVSTPDPVGVSGSGNGTSGTGTTGTSGTANTAGSNMGGSGAGPAACTNVAACGGSIGSYLGSRHFNPVVIKRFLAIVLLIAGTKLIFT